MMSAAPGTFPKSLDPKLASPFTFKVLATTVKICSESVNGNFAIELLTVDPVAELEDDCFVVSIWDGGSPRMCSWRSLNETDENGRFIKGGRGKGFKLGGITGSRSDLGKHMYIIGRVVGPPRDIACMGGAS